jgi:hypothetical protein
MVRLAADGIIRQVGVAVKVRCLFIPSSQLARAAKSRDLPKTRKLASEISF